MEMMSYNAKVMYMALVSFAAAACTLHITELEFFWS
jgi:hypothetical protein